eukprot:gene10415-12174_t
MGAGEVFHGEGILAITKGLLQSGVSYVGGYQGAPVSHLLDVMVQAKPYMDELGVHVEACSNEASAAAMLGASIHYPIRGAVTWKSIVGTNVAADALSNLSSPGVTGGVLIVVGEDYGEGASVIQERTHAYALKSGMCLLDPRPELGQMVNMVEHGFRLSEASNMPVMMELRIRACHVRGQFVAKDNQAPKLSKKHLIDEPAGFNYMRLAHPPVTFAQEKRKVEHRLPAARQYIAEQRLNEHFEGSTHRHLGLIVQGGLYNTLMRTLQQFDLADAFGVTSLSVLVAGEMTIWDSLAICEYLAEQFPEKHMWPQDVAARAMARSVCAEMHSGFSSLRNSMSMNVKGSYPGKGRTPGTQADIGRISEIWEECLSRFGHHEFLFGEFSIADAYYAPVVMRFKTYGVVLHAALQRGDDLGLAETSAARAAHGQDEGKAEARVVLCVELLNLVELGRRAVREAGLALLVAALGREVFVDHGLAGQLGVGTQQRQLRITATVGHLQHHGVLELGQRCKGALGKRSTRNPGRMFVQAVQQRGGLLQRGAV